MMYGTSSPAPINPIINKMKTPTTCRMTILQANPTRSAHTRHGEQSEQAVSSVSFVGWHALRLCEGRGNPVPVRARPSKNTVVQPKLRNNEAAICLDAPSTRGVYDGTR